MLYTILILHILHILNVIYNIDACTYSLWHITPNYRGLQLATWTRGLRQWHSFTQKGEINYVSQYTNSKRY